MANYTLPQVFFGDLVLNFRYPNFTPIRRM